MKHRYRFHHEHLDFVKEKRSVRKILWQVLLYVLAIAFMTVAYYLAYSLFFDTPEERAMKRENALLQAEVGQLAKKMDQVAEVMGELETRDREIYQAIFHADMSPLNNVLSYRYEDYADSNNDHLTTATAEKISALKVRAADVKALMAQLTDSLQRYPVEKRLAYPFLQPVDNPDLSRVGASVGMRMHPFYKLLKQHTGIDFMPGMGADVYATGAGRVIKVVRSQRGTGNRVEIAHDNGYITTYSHLSEVLAHDGQTVKRGQLIARVGNTGMSVAPHLHYEILKDGNYMDPLNYMFLQLSPADYEVLRQLSTSAGQSLD